ncbi:MAG: hypothetical protein RR054_06120 [Clostridia bacterium]
MFYKKELKYRRKYVTKRVMLTDFSEPIKQSVQYSINVPFETAVKLQNISADGNGAALNFGISSMTLPSTTNNITKEVSIYVPKQMTKMWHFNNTIFAIDKTLELYYLPVGSPEMGFIKLPNILFTKQPQMFVISIDSMPSAVFTSPSATDNLYIWRSPSVDTISIPSVDLKCATIFGNKIFGIPYNSNIIYALSNFDITTWNIENKQSATIDCIGKLFNICQVDGSLYGIGKYGICRIKNSESDFSLANVFLSSEQLIENSLCINGNDLYFSTSKGIYRLSDGVVFFISDSVSPNLNDCATIDNGFYRITNNNTLFSYSILNKTSFTSPIDNTSFLCYIPSASRSVIGYYDKSPLGIIDAFGSTFGLLNDAIWTSPNTVFNAPDKLKRLHSISIYTSNTTEHLNLTVNCDNTSYYFVVNSSGGFANISIEKAAHTFSFSLATKCGASVRIGALCASYSLI